MYFTNKFERATYVTRVLHFNHLSCNSFLTSKKTCNWSLIWALIVPKKNLQL